ncbi:hypothetical protein PCE1_004414 [Barthelona sp. PCE]
MPVRSASSEAIVKNAYKPESDNSKTAKLQNFSQTHIRYMLVILLAGVALILFGNISQQTNLWIRRFIGIVIGVNEVILQVGSFMREGWREYLQLRAPCHLCFFSVLLVFLLTLFIPDNRFLWEILWYWSFPALVAILTPDAPASFSFRQLSFFVSHGLICITAFYSVFVVNLRPRFISSLLAFLIAWVMSVISYPLNLLIGGKANYFFSKSKPDVSNPLLMGEWPYYMLGMWTFGIVVFVASGLPFIFLPQVPLNY